MPVRIVKRALLRQLLVEVTARRGRLVANYLLVPTATAGMAALRLGWRFFGWLLEQLGIDRGIEI
jgi:hypothetical protein